MVVDLFGGSGLLSHIAKRTLPDCQVIWNDYDNYNERLANVDKTNKLLHDLRIIVKDFSKHAKLDASTRELVLKRIASEQGYIDWVTLSSNILFTMNYELSFEGLASDTLYNFIRLSDYNVEGYLDGIEPVKMDYKELYTKYRDTPGVLFLVDPPYLSTDWSSYKSDGYWSLKDYLDVLKVLVNSNYIYFTSNKSSIIELCEWIGDNVISDNPLKGAIKTVVHTKPSINSAYEDIMLVRRRPCK